MVVCSNHAWQSPALPISFFFLHPQSGEGITGMHEIHMYLNLIQLSWSQRLQKWQMKHGAGAAAISAPMAGKAGKVIEVQSL